MSIYQGTAFTTPARTTSSTSLGPDESAGMDGLITREKIFRRVLLVITVFAIPTLAVIRPVQDADIWWHLRTGQWIVEHGAIPTADPFSSYGLGKPWMVYSWLFEVLVYRLYQGLGLPGIILYRIVSVFTVTVAVYRLVTRREPRFAHAIGLVGLAFVALAPLFSERPWHFSILFCTLTLHVIIDLREGRESRVIWFLPLLYVLWANLHIQFVNGLILLGLACVAPLADRLLGIRPGQHAASAGSRPWWRLVALTAACLAATLFNPYNYKLYEVVLEYAMTSFGGLDSIQEMSSLRFRSITDWAFLALIGWAFFKLGRLRRLSTFDVLLLVGTAYVSFHSGRDCWYAVLAAVSIIPSGRRMTGSAEDRFPMTWTRTSIVSVGVVCVMAILCWTRHIGGASLEREVATCYPAKAVEFVQDRGYTGPLYNHFNWGGYLIWRLHSLPVSMDGRTNVHGAKRFRKACETYTGQLGWESDPDLKAAKVVIYDAKQPLASLLRLDPSFELVYEDSVAVVFVARPSSP